MDQNEHEDNNQTLQLKLEEPLLLLVRKPPSPLLQLSSSSSSTLTPNAANILRQLQGVELKQDDAKNNNYHLRNKNKIKNNDQCDLNVQQIDSNVELATEWTSLLVADCVSSSSNKYAPSTTTNVKPQQQPPPQSPPQSQPMLLCTTTSTKCGLSLPLYLLFVLDGIILSLPSLAYLYIINVHVQMPLSLLPSYASLSFLPYSLKPLFAILSNRILLLPILVPTQTTTTTTTVPDNQYYCLHNNIMQRRQDPRRDLLLVTLLVCSAVCTGLTCTIPKATITDASDGITRNGTSAGSIFWCYVWGITRSIFTAWSEYMYQWIMIDEGTASASAAAAAKIPATMVTTATEAPPSQKTTGALPSQSTSTSFAEIASLYQSQSSTARNIGSLIASIGLLLVLLSSLMLLVVGSGSGSDDNSSGNTLDYIYDHANNSNNNNNGKTSFRAACWILLVTSSLQLLSAIVAYRYKVGRIGGSLTTPNSTLDDVVPTSIEDNKTNAKRTEFDTSNADDNGNSWFRSTENNLMMGRNYNTDSSDHNDDMHRLAVHLVVSLQVAVVLLLVRQPLSTYLSSTSLHSPNSILLLLSKWSWYILFTIPILYILYLLYHKILYSPSSSRSNNTNNQRWYRTYGIGIFLIVQNSMPDVSYLFTSYLYSIVQKTIQTAIVPSMDTKDNNKQVARAAATVLVIMQLFSIWDTMFTTLACWSYGRVLSKYHNPYPPQQPQHNFNPSYATSVETTTTTPFSQHPATMTRESQCLQDKYNGTSSTSPVTTSIARRRDYTNLTYMIIGTTVLASLASLLNIITIHVLQPDHEHQQPSWLLTFFSSWLTSSSSSTAAVQTGHEMIKTVLVVLMINAIASFTSEWKFIPEIVLATIASVDDDDDNNNNDTDPYDSWNVVERNEDSNDQDTRQRIRSDNNSANSCRIDSHHCPYNEYVSICDSDGNGDDTTSNHDATPTDGVIRDMLAAPDCYTRTSINGGLDHSNSVDDTFIQIRILSNSTVKDNDKLNSGCTRGNSSAMIGTKYSSFLSCIDFGDQIGSIVVGALISYIGTSRENNWMHLDWLVLICSFCMVLPSLFLLLL